MAHRRMPLALVAVAATALMFVFVSSASAYTRADQAKERKQNSRIKTALKGVNTQKLANDAQTAQLKTIEDLAKSVDARLKVIEGAAPQIIDGLSQLKTAAEQLKTGLETAGAGLTSLKTLAGAVEYGIGQVVIGATAQGGSFVVTPDIPDAVQQAMTTQQFVAQNAGPVSVLYGVRSGESDGTGSALPAAHCRVTVTNEAGDIATTAANPSLGGLPFQPVNDKSALTSTIAANAGFPFGLKTTAPDEDKTTTFASGVSVATAGDSYEVALSCVDTSASSTDPSA
jgi:hypothetical protein